MPELELKLLLDELLPELELRVGLTVELRLLLPLLKLRVELPLELRLLPTLELRLALELRLLELELWEE